MSIWGSRSTNRPPRTAHPWITMLSIYASPSTQSTLWCLDASNIVRWTHCEKDVCLAILFFYCLTGCDTVSSLTGKGKCKGWDTWFNSKNKDEFTSVFNELGNQPVEITAAQLDKLEEFLRQLYSITENSLGAHRLSKFQKSTDDLRKLPPSKEAFLQHIKGSCYQSGCIWQECLSDLQLPDPKLWGWEYDENRKYKPNWLCHLLILKNSS